MVASVLIWTVPAQSQGRQATPPVAIGFSRITTAAAPGVAATATLFGQSSFDADNQGEQADLGTAARGIVRYDWEVVTPAYSWVQLTPAVATDNVTQTPAAAEAGAEGYAKPNANFTVPSQALAARYGQSIEFRLTVRDGDEPFATSVATVTFNINQGPTADIALSAMVANPDDNQWYDDDGNGRIDDLDELYSVEGVIDGPGENGNADNEWDIAEGSRLILDGSGSTDPDGRPIAAVNHDWDLLYRTDDNGHDTCAPNDFDFLAADSVAMSTVSCTLDNRYGAHSDTGTPGDAGISDTKKLDIHTTSASSTSMKKPVRAGIGHLTNGNGTPHGPVFVYYKLTVTDAGGAMGSSIVKIVVHDQPAAPEVALDDIQPAEWDDNDRPNPEYAKIQKVGTLPGVTPRYVVLPGTKVDFTARGSDGDGDNPSYSWEGATPTDVDGMIDVLNLDTREDLVDMISISGSTATWTAPRNAEDGTMFTVTVTATDVTGNSGTAVFELIVANNRRPEAVAPGSTGGIGTFLFTVDGSDGGDLRPEADNSQTIPVLKPTGVQTLRGFGFDPDGGNLIFNWSELAYYTVPVGAEVHENTKADDDAYDSKGQSNPGDLNDPNNDTMLAVGGLYLAETGDAKTPAPRNPGYGWPDFLRVPQMSVLEIDNAFGEVASFEVPEVDDGRVGLGKHQTVWIDDTGDWDRDGCAYKPSNDPLTACDDTMASRVRAVAVPVAFTVVDSYGVIDTDIVTVLIIDNPDGPSANAGADQKVNSGEFVRLSAALSSDPDPQNPVLQYQWRYKGMVATDPLTEDRVPITAAEQAQGFAEGKWFPYDGISYVYFPDNTNIPHDADTDPDLVQVFNNHTLYEYRPDPWPSAANPQRLVYNLNGAGASAGSLIYDDPATSGVNEATWPVEFSVLPPREELLGADSDGDRILDTVDTNDDNDDADDVDDRDDDGDGTFDQDAVRGQYHPTAGGLLFNVGSSYRYSDRARVFPYFDAPRLSNFHSVEFEFELRVLNTYNVDPLNPNEVHASDTVLDVDTVRVSVVSKFYTGNIDGPDFCTGLSLGGPSTYAFDSDDDGVADVCSLRTTRRATVAIQNALETLAALNPDMFKEYLHGRTAVVPGAPLAGTCKNAPADLGDTQAQLLGDACGRGRVAAPPLPADPATAGLYFSGVITGPTYCTNLSLGGATTYAFDSDGDGVADVCSLPYTRREAVARQNALAKFQDHAQYGQALDAACASLGTLSYGDSAFSLARDECGAPDPEPRGTPLPTQDN